jgi:hypothetical protein
MMPAFFLLMAVPQRNVPQAVADLHHLFLVAILHYYTVGDESMMVGHRHPVELLIMNPFDLGDAVVTHPAQVDPRLESRARFHKRKVILHAGTHDAGALGEGAERLAGRNGFQQARSWDPAGGAATGQSPREAPHKEIRLDEA